MTEDSTKPTLVCHDGSKHSLHSLEALDGLLAPTEVVVLTVSAAAGHEARRGG